MIKAALKFINYMELKYKISIPKEPLIEFAKEVYHLGFSESHTSDEQPCGNSGVFDGTCNVYMNEWHTSDEQPCGNSGVFDGTCNVYMNEWNY